ncbi:UNVERIFIED_ORG: hypothetical protein ABIC43_006966 [Variovorax guangxiensis]
MLLASCTYSQINPEAALEDIRTNNGYYELKSIEPGTAKLVLRTPGAAATSAAAQFAVSTAEAPCEGFQHLGAAASSGHGVVYPWIARATRVGSGAEPFLLHQATPGQPIQIRGIGRWSTSGAGVAFRAGSCGPVALRFTPAENRAYAVEFIWEKDMTCRLAVMDATDPDAPQPVVANSIPGCPAPAR